MAIFKIVEVGDIVLKEKARPVTKFNDNLIKLLDNMADTMYAAEGVGLAAPQIGIGKRVIVLDVGEGLIEMINPEIIGKNGLACDVEGCLSIPGVVGTVERAENIKVKGLNRHGEEIMCEASGLLSRAFQHEIDHLDGILFVDKATDIQTRK